MNAVLTACPVVLDVVASTVTIAGRTRPACSLVCPQHERDEPRDRWSHTLNVGPNPYSFDVYVPSESGVIVEVTTFMRDGRWRVDLHLLSRYCVEATDGGWCWLPAALRVTSKISYNAKLISVCWLDCDPEWVNEHIDRLFSMDVDVSLIVDNPTVDLIPLAEARP